jgi:hypothetical protein
MGLLLGYSSREEEVEKDINISLRGQQCQRGRLAAGLPPGHVFMAERFIYIV